MFNIKTLSVKKDRWIGFSLEQLIQKFESYDSILCENNPSLKEDRAFLKDCILFRCHISNGWKNAAFLAEEGSELERICCENIDFMDVNKKNQATSILSSPKDSQTSMSRTFIFEFSLN